MTSKQPKISKIGHGLPDHLTKDEKKAIIFFKKKLHAKYPKELIAIKLFGSKARGNIHSESDVDILILVEKRSEQFDEFVIDLICEVLNQFGVYLETVTYGKKDYQEALDLQYPFLLNIERDSINI